MPYDQGKQFETWFGDADLGTRKALTQKTLGSGSLGTSSKDVHSHDDETLVPSPLAMAMALFLAA